MKNALNYVTKQRNIFLSKNKFLSQYESIFFTRNNSNLALQQKEDNKSKEPFQVP